MRSLLLGLCVCLFLPCASCHLLSVAIIPAKRSKRADRSDNVGKIVLAGGHDVPRHEGLGPWPIRFTHVHASYLLADNKANDEPFHFVCTNHFVQTFH